MKDKKQNIKVYRIEHPSIFNTVGNYPVGVGPYNLEQYYDEIPEPLLYLLTKLIDMHHTSEKHPALICDIRHHNMIMSSNIIAACPNPTALNLWFGEFYEDLIRHGLVIIEYTVPKIYMGKSKIQCAFNTDDIVSKKIIQP